MARYRSLTRRRWSPNPPNLSRNAPCILGRNRLKCSCCPWMSTSGAAISASSPALTVRPLTREKFRPVARISRPSVSTSGESPSSPSRSKIGVMSRCRVLGRWNCPSTTADLVSARTTSLVARPPSSRLTASMMIDFPAPVSPVSTLKPPVKARCSSSIMAKFLMVSSVSIEICHSYSVLRIL